VVGTVKRLSAELPDQFANEALRERTGLPLRLRGALMNEGLRTVGDVRDLSDINLRCVRRIGNDSFQLLRKMFGPSRQSHDAIEKEALMTVDLKRAAQ
jgi:hypothetical protein